MSRHNTGALPPPREVVYGGRRAGGEEVFHTCRQPDPIKIQRNKREIKSILKKGPGSRGGGVKL